MKKIFTFILVFNALVCSAYEPLHVTKKDLKELKRLDEDIYELSTHEKSYNFEQVANFIYRNLGYKIDYSLLHVEIGARARTSAIATGTSYDKNRLAGTMTLTYPIFDPKEKNDKKKQMIIMKQTIISKTQDYFLLKAQLHDYKIQKEILLDKEIRLKARKLTAVGSFNDWATIMDKIRITNMNIIKTELALSKSKQTLLAYVHEENRKELKEML